MMPRQRKKLSLLQWGLICIFAGTMTQLVSPILQGPPRDRSELLGRSVAVLLILVVGLGMCVAHFVRQWSRPKKGTRPATPRQRPTPPPI
jgi:hypothetical protein